MTRPIKFRAKRKDNGKWEYGSYLVVEGYHFIVPFDSIVETTKDFADALRHARFILVDEKTVGQITGLLDKNGKEIYEGDILERETVSTGNRRKEIVTWSKRGGWQPLYSIKGTLEVIGNIYENPSLINE